MKPKPFSALNHFTVPVAITNFLQERFVDPDSRGRSSRCSSSAPDWNTAYRRHKAASVHHVRITATTGWRLPQTGRIPPLESYSFEDDLLSHPVGASPCPPKTALPSHRACVMSTRRPASAPRTKGVPSARQCASASSCRPSGASPLARITRHQVTDEPKRDITDPTCREPPCPSSSATSP